MLHENRLILLVGATGVLGRRLLPRLEEAGYRVRCLAADPRDLEGCTAAGTEIVRGDVLAPATLDAAMDGVDTAFYLVPASGSGCGDDADRRDRQAAANAAEAARMAGVRRLIVLGSLDQPRDPLAMQRPGRQPIGQVLRTGGVPVIEFRASLILGAGTPAFELVRGLVERLPVILCPRGIDALKQPIALDDVLRYLLAGIETPTGHGRVFEIGGPDRVTFCDILREYARLRGLRRVIAGAPALTPRLSRLWLSAMAPRRAGVGRRLIDELHGRSLIDDPAALTQFPEIRPINLHAQLARAAGLPATEPQPGNGQPRAMETAGPARGLDRWIEQAWRQEHRLLSAVSRRRMTASWQPAVDVLETADSLLVVLEVPGVAPNGLDVVLRENCLTVRGRKESPPVGTADVLLRGERAAGPFERTIPLHMPVDPDAITAEVENGLMRVRLAKRSEAITRRVPVAGGKI